MIQFNKLEVDKNNNLVVDVQVKDKDYYKNVYLGDLYIDTQDTYNDNGPSDKALKFSLAGTQDTITSKTYNIENYTDTAYKRDKKYIVIQDTYTVGSLICATFTFNLDYTEYNLQPDDNYRLIFKHSASDSVLGSFDMEKSISKGHGILSVKVENAGNYVDKSMLEKQFVIEIAADSPNGEGGVPDIITMLHNDDENFDVEIQIDYVTKRDIAYNLKSKTLEIPKNVYPSLDNNILYVYAKTSDNSVPSASTPCGEDNIYTLGVVVNNNIIYNKGISYIKELGNTCNIPKGFISYILEYNAFNLALKTKNYSQANIYWNRFFKGSSSTINTKSCGCNK